MGSAVARHTAGREALAARLEAGQSPAMARLLAGFRLEGRTRGLGQVVGVRWEQANTASAAGENSGRSLRALQDAALLAVLFDDLRPVDTGQEGEGAVQYIGKRTVEGIRAWLVASAPVYQCLDKDGRPTSRPGNMCVRVSSREAL